MTPMQALDLERAFGLASRKQVADQRAAVMRISDAQDAIRVALLEWGAALSAAEQVLDSPATRAIYRRRYAASRALYDIFFETLTGGTL